MPVATQPAPDAATRQTPPVDPGEGWLEVWQGTGNGHALAAVHIENVAIRVSNGVAKGVYCEGPFDPGNTAPAAFGVIETLLLEGERRLYYQIDHQPNGAWRYSTTTDDGETNPGSPLCAACHERGASDPFFRPFVSDGCK